MIPYLDLKAQYHQIKPEVDAAIARVVESGNFVLGPEVAEFEERFAEYCDTRHCVAVNSGTSALHLALLAAGIRPGDEVITVSMTFVATVAAILYVGAKPVLVDVDPATWTLDPDLIEEQITPRTKAIIPVHLHGLTADMDRILEIARAYGIQVIEDAAQAHGAGYKGRAAGSLGEIGCFSFYPGKNLGAYGEGGAVVTNDPDLAQKISLLRNWGQGSKYFHDLPGYNFRMDAIQAAVLNVKMNYIEQWTEGRRAVAAQYDRLLGGSYCKRPASLSDYRHVYHVYSIAVDYRDHVRRALDAEAVGSSIHYPVPVHLQKAYAALGYREGDLPVTEQLARQFLSLPIYPELTSHKIADVVRVIEGALELQPA
jgi:dTDP-4-amino-4,6-dideoxygalactose transaminase